jgi:excisionase family DNA binding protein
MSVDMTSNDLFTPVDPLFNVKEGARYLRISPTTVRQLIDDGEVPVVKYKRKTFIRRSELDSFIDRHQTSKSVESRMGEQ